MFHDDPPLNHMFATLQLNTQYLVGKYEKAYDEYTLLCYIFTRPVLFYFFKEIKNFYIFPLLH